MLKGFNRAFRGSFNSGVDAKNNSNNDSRDEDN